MFSEEDAQKMLEQSKKFKKMQNNIFVIKQKIQEGQKVKWSEYILALDTFIRHCEEVISFSNQVAKKHEKMYANLTGKNFE